MHDGHRAVVPRADRDAAAERSALPVSRVSVDFVRRVPIAFARRFGVGLTCSEMISARALVHRARVMFRRARPAEGERPYAVQLADHDPAILAEAARTVEGEGLADIVDLNMGCPSRTVVGSGNGAALLRTPELIAAIVRAVRQATTLTLSVKLRLGWDDQTRNHLDVTRICEEEGADFLVVHGRTRTQMFSGRSDWTAIGEVKAARKIPVVGNGDVTSAEAARRLLAQAACDGVMIARGVFGDPWLIERILKNDDSLNPGPEERCALALEHLALQCAYDGETQGVKKLRKHLAWYVRGLAGAAVFRKRAMTIPDRAGVEREVRRFFAELTGTPAS
ncbi:MAG: tRNA dihydrouridine synthase DusB [Myxococcales bacterium]|nr:MAG: tRNA dihydrouridine synthase DusB [Myxococcales bacterium]